MPQQWPGDQQDVSDEVRVGISKTNEGAGRVHWPWLFDRHCIQVQRADGHAASPLGRRQMIDRTKETKVIAFETQSL